DTLERVQILRDLRLGVYDALVGINLLREGIDLPEVTLVAILDADKEGFLRSTWSLIQVIGRAARNTEGQVVMYADVMTESMKAAIDETNRRRAKQIAYNTEHGIEPRTIIKEIRDINDRLRAVAEAPGAYATGRGGQQELTEMSKEQIAKMVAQLEAEMRNAAKQLEFERAAAIRDQIQTIRLRVLEEDASVTVGRAAERAAAGRGGGGPAMTGGVSAGGASRAAEGSETHRGEALVKPSERMAAMKAGDRRGRRLGTADADAPPGLEVTSVTVLDAGDEPGDALDGHPDHEAGEDELGTASDWLPGIRDEHEGDDAGWMARWLEKPTWDRSVTPNVIKRTGTRPRQRR
ncbi:MAG: UvrB/UvrC motif-containing protein, partial [Chloroflexi bacterium]|nr:UvrB/UvrC motif-containing protein [Chloroflexota bacterium]